VDIRADFTKPSWLHHEAREWAPGSSDGLQEIVLDRYGARTTALVRMPPGVRLGRQVHRGGAEIYVLEGAYEEDLGRYGSGSYLRYPPGSFGTPRTARGCTLLVKRWQFDRADRSLLGVRAADRPRWQPEAMIHVKELFEGHGERVRMEQWRPHQRIDRAPQGGTEIVVLDGTCLWRGQTFRARSWLRCPAALELDVGPRGCTVWVKDGGLADAVARYEALRAQPALAFGGWHTGRREPTGGSPVS
jgi:hypothetical protein